MSSDTSQLPIDLQQLARYTGGDSRLDSEVLALFACQISLGLDRLEELLGSADATTWREIAHSLKGTALCVGAGGLAGIAARIETRDPATAPCEAAEALAALKAEGLRVAAFIEARRQA